jgi:hypothetical protein
MLGHPSFVGMEWEGMLPYEDQIFTLAFSPQEVVLASYLQSDSSELLGYASVIF